MTMNNWRVLRYNPGAAHLWGMTANGIWRSWCNRMAVIDLDAMTRPLTLEDSAHKCRCCIPGEVRRKDVAGKENPAGRKPRRAASAVSPAG